MKHVVYLSILSDVLLKFWSLKIDFIYDKNIFVNKFTRIIVINIV